MINLVISYDYELAWGVWDSLPDTYIHSNVANSNKCAEALIELHTKYKLKATWAVVGSAFSTESARSIISKEFYTAREREIAQKKIKIFEEFEKNPNIVSIPTSTIKKIKNSSYFEFASHTYSHRFSHKQSKENLINDFSRFRDACSTDEISSIVFPRNIVTKDALEVSAMYGFRFIRVNPSNILYRSIRRPGFIGTVIRLFRYLDSFLPIQEILPVRQDSASHDQYTLCVGQYFFRPDCGGTMRDWIHRKRLILGFRICLIRGQDFHIWSHPHNFGSDVEKAIGNCEILFKYLNKYISKGEAASKRMCDLDNSAGTT